MFEVKVINDHCDSLNSTKPMKAPRDVNKTISSVVDKVNSCYSW